MRYIAAYLLLKIGGNEAPSASDIKKVIQSVGIEVDEERVDSLLSELNGKDINAVRCRSLSTSETRSTYHFIAHRRGH
jgi:large subunit ribosomal protein LP2